ncbi:MAG: hypothetical protein Ct9H300mP15_26400 [Gemmatimonadota bacterium]|nr:MAG: hypothetical protein Ct9H300mP15_26400 [Gemmatimonadota bacterium]
MIQISRTLVASALMMLVGQVSTLGAQSTGPNQGPVGPSPYNIISGWHKPFAEEGFAFGGSSGVFAESPNRIFVAQRGETRLPGPNFPPSFPGLLDLSVSMFCLLLICGSGSTVFTRLMVMAM